MKQTLTPNEITFSYMYGEDGFLKYSSNHPLYDEIEVQFDNDEFSGNIYVAALLKDDEWEHIYEALEEGELYEIIKCMAIKDYQEKFLK